MRNGVPAKFVSPLVNSQKSLAVNTDWLMLS